MRIPSPDGIDKPGLMTYDPLPSFIITNRREEKGQTMKMTFLRCALLFSTLLPITACDTSLSVGSRTIGIRSGEFLYTDGYLRTTYTAPLEKVWAACDKTLTELKAVDVEREKAIATGTYTALIQDDKVRVSVEYVEREITAVSIMVGPSGNNLASQLIHDRIAAALTRP
jgi:hypothetical protein